jgi:hypothetical protein
VSNKKFGAAVALIIAYFIFMFVFIFIGEDANKKECASYGGTWLPKNGQCVFK